jgi:transcriptional regulator GlxA family with amidase domain
MRSTPTLGCDTFQLPRTMLHHEHCEGSNLSDSIQAQVSAPRNESTSWRYISRRRDIQSAPAVSRSLRPGVLQRALTYMEANLGERFSLETLAEAAGMSRFHFARVFRIATGCSPMEFLMRQRVARGKEILLQGEMSICDVAALLGFCDQSHFTRTFRRVAGMSPREYLRKCADTQIHSTYIQESRRAFDHDSTHTRSVDATSA